MSGRTAHFRGEELRRSSEERSHGFLGSLPPCLIEAFAGDPLPLSLPPNSLAVSESKDTYRLFKACPSSRNSRKRTRRTRSARAHESTLMTDKEYCLPCILFPVITFSYRRPFSVLVLVAGCSSCGVPRARAFSFHLPNSFPEEVTWRKY